MARVSTFLNMPGTTEEAFGFYSRVFGTAVTQLVRFADAGMDDMPEHERSGVLHVELEILAGHVIMGTDVTESSGMTVTPGNNTTINLEPDTREDADRLYAGLAEGSPENTGGLSEMPWDAYWGSCLDRYGIRWMFNVPNQR